MYYTRGLSRAAYTLSTELSSKGCWHAAQVKNLLASAALIWHEGRDGAASPQSTWEGWRSWVLMLAVSTG